MGFVWDMYIYIYKYVLDRVQQGYIELEGVFERWYGVDTLLFRES